MLREGRRQSAAAIFEAIARVSPGDAAAHNNFGFCLLPDDPGKALEELETAASLGMASRGTNVGNRMLALCRLDRTVSALALAEEYFEGGADRETANRPAFMWSFELDDPKLLEVGDVAVYVAELAAHSSVSAGDAQLGARWSDRAARARKRNGK